MVAAANPWLTAASIFSKVLGGSSETSQAGATSGGDLNFDTSGVAIGGGSAVGGDLSTSFNKPDEWPWYVWGAIGLVGVATMKKVA